MLSKVKRTISAKARKLSKSHEDCKSGPKYALNNSLPDLCAQESVTLTQQCGFVPTVLVNAAKIIEARIAVKCLFQIQGSTESVEYLINILGRDRMTIPRNINIHDVVEVVKVYLGRLASPVMPDEIMSRLIENHNAGRTLLHTDVIFQYRQMMPDVVPSVHFVLLLMNKVSNLSHVNGMDARKLATIFVLDILKPLSVPEIQTDYEQSRLERVQKLPYNIMVVEYLILNVEIFESTPIDRNYGPFLGSPLQELETELKDDQGDSATGNTKAKKDIPLQNDNNKQLHVTVGNNEQTGDGIDNAMSDLNQGFSRVASPDGAGNNKPKPTRDKLAVRKVNSQGESSNQSKAVNKVEKSRSDPKHRRKGSKESRGVLKSKTPSLETDSKQNNVLESPPPVGDLDLVKEKQKNLNKINQEQPGSVDTQGKVASVKPPLSPTRSKRAQNNQKLKKRPLSYTTSYSGKRASSRESSATGRYHLKNPKNKKGKLKIEKQKMFKNNEELQPWDGIATESEDISLIIRTTKNPKTFQFLENHFSNSKIPKDKSYQTVVVDTFKSPNKSRTKRRRNKNRGSIPSPKRQGSNKTMILVKTVSNSSQEINDDGSSAERQLISPLELDTKIENKDHHSNNNVIKLPKSFSDVNIRNESIKHIELTIESRSRKKPHQPAASPKDSNPCVVVINNPSHAPSTTQKSRTATETSKKTGRVSKEEQRHQKSNTSCINAMGSQEKRSLFCKIMDWVVDTSLLGVAILCAAYIYTVV